MSDKHLSASAWKAFAKNKAYKDAALLKALADLDKFGTDRPDERLKALDEAEKQSEQLAKSVKGDKDLIAYAADIGKQIKVDRKSVETARANREKEAAAEASEDDDAPDLLTTKLASLLKEVRRGVPMHAMLAIGSPDSAVLLSRKPLAAARRNLLIQYLGTSSGIKFPIGQCIWEENAFTFVMASASVAPAKKVRTALKEQIGTLSKVRVRGMDPADIDEGDEDRDDGEGNEPATAKSAAPPASPVTAKPAGAAPAPGPNAPAPMAAKPATGPAADVMARLQALQPQVKAKLAEGGPAEKDVKLLVSEISALVRQNRIPAALSLIDALEKRLGKAAPNAGTRAEGIPPAPPLPPTKGKPADAATIFKTRLSALQPRIKDVIAGGGPAAARVTAHNREMVALAQNKDFTAALAALTKLEGSLGSPSTASTARPEAAKGRPTSTPGGTLGLWQDARDTVSEQLAGLGDALRTTGHPLLIRIAELGLNGLTKRLQVGLHVALTDYDAATRDARTKAATKVHALLADYRNFLKSDATLPLLESNPLGVALEARARLGGALDRIEARLKADQG